VLFDNPEQSNDGSPGAAVPKRYPATPLVDGATFGPSSYDSIIAHIPSDAVVDDITTILFGEADWYFSVLDKPYFDELRRLWDLRKAHGDDSVRDVLARGSDRPVFVRDESEVQYYPTVLFQVMALALHFLPTSCPTRDILKLHSHAEADRLSKIYSDTGQELMKILGRIDSPITGVIADVMRCAWLKNSGLGSHSWHALNDAVRQAQDLGLHLQSDVETDGTIEQTVRALWYDEFRRRVWVCVFTWDAHMALNLGRTRMINVGDCTVQKPMDCNIPDNPAQVVPVPATVTGRPSMYTCQLFKYTTGLKIHEILSSGALRSPVKDYSLVTRLHNDILAMVDELPPASRQDSPDTQFDVAYPNFAKQRLQISIVAQAVLMALHRPHVTQHKVSRDAAIDAALKILDASQSLFEFCGEHHYRIHTLIFHTIDSTIFLTSMVLRHYGQSEVTSPTSNGSSISSSPGADDGFPMHAVRYALLQAVTRTNHMKSRSTVARAGDKVLRRCSELVAQREREARARITQQTSQTSSEGSTPKTANIARSATHHNFLTDAPPDMPTHFPWMAANSAIPNTSNDNGRINGPATAFPVNTSLASSNIDHLAISSRHNADPYTTTTSYEQIEALNLPDYDTLFNETFIDSVSNTTVWMEQNGLFEQSSIMPVTLPPRSFETW
jgi:hypothetical protein